MQHSDERPPTSGRPSLLSSEQQAEADRHRILGTLDDKSGGAVRTRPRFPWLAGAVVAMLALTGGAAVWLSSEGEKEIVLASSAPLPAAPADAAALVSEPPAANPEADDVSTAAILQDVPPAAAMPAAPPAVPDGGKPGADELTSLLERPSADSPPPALAAAAPAAATPVAKPAPKTDKPAARPAARPEPKKVVVAKAAPAKTGSKTVAKKEHKPAPKTAAGPAPAKKKLEAAPKAVDTDVTLLAALVAHAKATQPKKASPASDKLRQCKKLASVAEADECRARLCASSARNEAECRAPRLAKAPGP